MKSRMARRTALMVLIPVIASCAQGAVLRGQAQGLGSVIENAEKNGAKTCAPRELALAKSKLRFATVALDQGDSSRAEFYLSQAEPNARAALAMSPPERCGEGPYEPSDRDGDGHPDKVDKCPDQPENWNGYQDEDGCPDDPDTDGDKITDSKDSCVLEPEDRDSYLDEDGCPDNDNDADGVADMIDQCREKPEDLDGFHDEDGCPDTDNDDDTVADLDDFCPNTPGPATGSDRPGCPRKNSLIVVTAREVRILQQIQFEFNKATIKRASFPILDAVRDALSDHPKMRLEVQGHTDNVGNAGYNMKLSQARAESVRKYLTSHGIDSSRLAAKGYGMSQPLVPNDTDAHRALNRRVQFIRTESTP